MNGSFPVPQPSFAHSNISADGASPGRALSHVVTCAVGYTSLSFPSPTSPDCGTRRVALQLGGASPPAAGSAQDTSLGTRQLLQPFRKDALPLASLLGTRQNQILLESFSEKKFGHIK